MRVLVGCEFKGKIRDAFRRLGLDAWSCNTPDEKPEGEFAQYHHACDVREILSGDSRGPWNLAIFHPPCTYLTASGLHWNGRREGRAEKTAEALQFVADLLNAPISRIALENPRGCIGTRIHYERGREGQHGRYIVTDGSKPGLTAQRHPRDSVQPYEFGHDASKETILWLKGLPPLVRDPAKRVRGRFVPHPTRALEYVERWGNQTDSGQNRLAPSDRRWALRSETYDGIAAAMAAQWGGGERRLLI